jgi:hypothetical protein
MECYSLVIVGKLHRLHLQECIGIKALYMYTSTELELVAVLAGRSWNGAKGLKLERRVQAEHSTFFLYHYFNGD